MIVYTASDGVPLAPHRPWPGVRMIAYSVDPAPYPWEWVPLARTSDDPCRNAKRPKILPWEYLPEWDRAFWIDANLTLTRNPIELRGDLMAHAHRDRDCIYHEALECHRLRKDDPATINAQMDRYRDHPAHGGLWECGMLVRRNTDGVRSLCEDWWREIEAGSKRDQLSFPVVARRHGVTVQSLGDNIRASAWVR